MSLVTVLCAVAVIDYGRRDGGEMTKRGTAFAVGGESTRGQRTLVPGQSFINMDGVLENVEEDPVTIQKVTPVWAYGEEVAEVSRIRIGSRERTIVSLGNFYLRDPPSERENGVCIQQEMAPPHGYRVQPGEMALIVATVDVVTKGRFRIDGWLVTYELNGDAYSQKITTAVEGISGDHPLDPNELTRGECGGKLLWPGAAP